MVPVVIAACGIGTLKLLHVVYVVAPLATLPEVFGIIGSSNPPGL